MLAAGDRAADRRLLPGAAAEGRGARAERRHRRAVLGRGRDRRGDRRGQRRDRRDARDHLRAGVPVLDQGVRDLGPRLRAADPLRRAPGPRRAVRATSCRAPAPRARRWPAASGCSSRRPDHSRPAARVVHVAAGATRAAAARATSGCRPAGSSRTPTGSSRCVARSGRGRSAARGYSSPLLVYSLLVATFLGTMGLPHILVRFYTNPDGHAARHTTVRVLVCCRSVLRVPGRLRRARAGADAAAVRDRPDRRRRAAAAARRRGPGPVGTVARRRSPPPARSPRSCRPRRACSCRWPGRSRHDVWPRLRHERPTTRVDAPAAVPGRRGRRGW